MTGPQLFTVHPHGSTDKLPYVTMGSGSLAAMAVFESSWRAGLEVGVAAPVRPVLPQPPLTTAIAAPRSNRSRLSSNLRRYLQRSWIRFQRRRLCHHQRPHRHASKLPHSQRTWSEGEDVWVPKRDYSVQDGDGPEV